MGLALGAAIVFGREPSVFWLGTLGLVLGWSYHGPPLQLAYRGLGELDVVLCYGPIIALSSYLILTGQYAADPVWLSLPLGILIAAFLWVNEFPDYEADLGAGKNNLVARLGKRMAARMLLSIYGAAFLMLAVLPGLTGMPATIYLGFFAAVPAAAAAYWTLRDPESFHRHKPVQPMALLAFVVYAAGVSAGIMVGG